MKALLCIAVIAGGHLYGQARPWYSYTPAHTYQYFGFYLQSSTNDVFISATSDDGLSWSSNGGTWTSPLVGINAPDVLFYKGRYMFAVANASDNAGAQYTWILGAPDASGHISTLATIDWSSNISGLTQCFSGNFFIADDHSVHYFIPCSGGGASLNFVTYETHPTDNVFPFVNWSAPTPVSVVGVPVNGSFYDSRVTKIGETYWMLGTNIDLTSTDRLITLARSGSGYMGPYYVVASNTWAGFAHNSEGPYIFRGLNSGWRMGMDRLVTTSPYTHQTYISDCGSEDLLRCAWTTPVAITGSPAFSHGAFARTPLLPSGLL